MDLLDGGGHHCNDLRGFYYAVGNHAVPITMLESDTTDVALLASGDVRNLLRAVEECATRDNTKELNVLMNDISVSVTARNIALLALIHRCYRQSVEAGKNTDEALRVASGAFFSVQFELLLCKQHSQWLDDTLRELIEATSLSHVLPFVSLVDDAVLPKLKTVWSAWLHRRINDWEIPRTYSRRFLQVRQRGLQAQMIGAGSMIDGNISAAQMTDLRRRRQECFKNRVEMSMFTHRHLFYTRDSPVEIEFFFRHGVLKRKGQSAMRMRAICDIEMSGKLLTQVNASMFDGLPPTPMRPEDVRRFSLHYGTLPMHWLSPGAVKEADIVRADQSHLETLLRRCAAFVRHVTHVQQQHRLHVAFDVGSVLTVSQRTQRRFDFVDTTNVCDHVGTLALVAATQSLLRDGARMLVTSFMTKTKVSHTQSHAVWQQQLGNVPLHLLPLLFGVTPHPVHSSHDTVDFLSDRQTQMTIDVNKVQSSFDMNSGITSPMSLLLRRRVAPRVTLHPDSSLYRQVAECLTGLPQQPRVTGWTLARVLHLLRQHVDTASLARLHASLSARMNNIIKTEFDVADALLGNSTTSVTLLRVPAAGLFDFVVRHGDLLPPQINFLVLGDLAGNFFSNLQNLKENARGLECFRVDWLNDEVIVAVPSSMLPRGSCFLSAVSPITRENWIGHSGLPLSKCQVIRTIKRDSIRGVSVACSDLFEFRANAFHITLPERVAKKDLSYSRSRLRNTLTIKANNTVLLTLVPPIVVHALDTSRVSVDATGDKCTLRVPLLSHVTSLRRPAFSPLDLPFWPSKRPMTARTSMFSMDEMARSGGTTLPAHSDLPLLDLRHSVLILLQSRGKAKKSHGEPMLHLWFSRDDGAGVMFVSTSLRTLPSDHSAPLIDGWYMNIKGNSPPTREAYEIASYVGHHFLDDWNNGLLSRRPDLVDCKGKNKGGKNNGKIEKKTQQVFGTREETQLAQALLRSNHQQLAPSLRALEWRPYKGSRRRGVSALVQQNFVLRRSFISPVYLADKK